MLLFRSECWGQQREVNGVRLKRVVFSLPQHNFFPVRFETLALLITRFLLLSNTTVLYFSSKHLTLSVRGPSLFVII